MRRIQSACIIQTMHFLLKEELEHGYAGGSEEIQGTSGRKSFKI